MHALKVKKKEAAKARGALLFGAKRRDGMLKISCSAAGRINYVADVYFAYE